MIFRALPFLTARTLAEVVAVEATESDVTVVVIARRGDDVEVLRTARGPATGDLTADLRAALSSLGAAPRHGILVTPKATAVCVQVPPTRGLADERMASLVRYEVEPYLSPEEAPEPSELTACGWAARDLDAGGALFTSGVSARTWRSLEATFAAVGLRLEGVYPALACAPALIPPSVVPDATVLEVGQGRVSGARLQGGRVTRLTITRAVGAAAATDAGLALVEGDGPVVLAGPAPADLELALEGRVALRLADTLTGPDGVPLDPPSASLLGAARHALRAPGGERVPAIGRAPGRPLLAHPSARAAGVLLLAAALLAATELTLTGREAAAREALAPVQQEVALRQAAADSRKALERRRDDAQKALAPLEASLARAEGEDGRCRWLAELLETVARSLPGDVALVALRDEATGSVSLEGLALTPKDAHLLAADLARTRALAGRAPPLVAVHPDGERGCYGFTIRFGAVGAPSAIAAPTPARSSWGGD